MKKNITLIPINVKIRKLQIAISMLSKHHADIKYVLSLELDQLRIQKMELVKLQTRVRVANWRKLQSKKRKKTI